MTTYVKFTSVSQIVRFVEEVSKLEGDATLISESSAVNAKSLIGVFSLDLSKPLQLFYSSDRDENLSKLREYAVA